MRVAVLHPQTAFVRGGAETHAEALVRALEGRRPRRRPRADRRQVVPGEPARAPDGGLAELRHHRVQRPEGRRRDRAEVPRVPDRARAQDRLADPPAPHRVRAVGPPGVRRPLAPGRRRRRPRHGVERRPARAERGQARLHELEERAGAALVVAADPVRAPVPPVGRDRAPARSGRRPVRRLPALPEPHGEPEAPVARDRRDDARALRREARARGPRPRRAAAPRARGQARPEGQGPLRDRRERRPPPPALPGRARRLLRAVRRGLRLRHARGVRGRAPGRHAHRQRRPARVRRRRRDRVRLRRPSPRRSPRRSTGCSATTTWRPGWARPATRSSGPRCRAGPTSSRGCWTDAPLGRTEADRPRREREARGSRRHRRAGLRGAAPARADRHRDLRPRGPRRPRADRVHGPAPHGRHVADRAEGHAEAPRLPARDLPARATTSSSTSRSTAPRS